MQIQTAPNDKGDTRRTEGGLRLRGITKKSEPGQPLVTVITSTFNAADQLAGAVHSIREQSYENIEWLIVDGGSTDGTLEVILENEDVIDYWLSEPDSGIYDAWNKGLHQAHGLWVMFLGADDQLDSEWPRTVAERGHHHDLVYSNLLLVDRDSRDIVFTQRGVGWNTAKLLLRQFAFIPHPGLAHSARLFENCRFDPDFGSVADWEFLIRVQPESGLYIEEGIQASMTLGGISNKEAGLRHAIQDYFKVVAAHKLKLSTSVRFSKLIKLMLSRYPAIYAYVKRAYFLLYSRLDGGK